MSKRGLQFRELARQTFMVALLAVAASVLPVHGAAALPPAYFPPEVTEPREPGGWAILAAEFPWRIKRVAANDVPPLDSPPATRLETPGGFAYLRVRQLAADLDAIEQALAGPALVIDVRYVRADLGESRQLGALLSRHELKLETCATDTSTITIEPLGKRPQSQTTLVLINHGTAGPLEAVLDALQASRDVLLVGTTTKGDTGIFANIEGVDEWRIITGDYRRVGGPSLLEKGATPGLAVEITGTADEEAYLALDAGASLASLLDSPVEKPRFDEARLLRQFSNGDSSSTWHSAPGDAVGATAPNSGDATAPHAIHARAAFDRTLQRAVNVVITLEALHRLPGAENTK